MSDDELGSGPAAEPPAYDPTMWRASTDVLASEPEEPTKRAPWGLVGAAGVLVLALVGGVTYAVGALSGGGSQPADALPSGAFAAVTLDLDPSAGQKLDGFRFLRKFPALRDKVPATGDLREVMFDAVADDAGWGQRRLRQRGRALAGQADRRRPLSPGHQQHGRRPAADRRGGPAGQ